MSTPAGVWVRVSTGGQDERNQVPAVEAHCAQRGYEVCARYELRDRSAYHGEQDEALARALSDAREGRISRLVVWSADRLERRGAEALLRVLRQFREAGCPVESVKEPLLGTDDLAGEAVTALAGILARQESARKSERVREAHQRIDANGAFRGRVPWGYATTGETYARRLEPTAEGTRLVPEVFARVGAGDSCATVAAWLAAQGATPPTRRGQWWAKSVAEMIRRRVYMGYHVNGAGVVAHRCPPLVDAAAWQRANDRLDAPAKRGPAAREPAMLRGAVLCGDCGGTMLRLDAGTRRKDGTKNILFYYRCYGVPGPQRKGCGTMVRLDAADRAVDEIMATALRDEPVMRRVTVPGTNYAAELAAIGFELTELPRQGLEEEAEDERRAELRAERKRLRSLPAVPDTWRDEPTGQTYRDVWEALPHPERGAWLAAHHFTVWLTRDLVSLTESGPLPWDEGYRPPLTDLLPARVTASGRVRHAVRLRPAA